MRFVCLALFIIPAGGLLAERPLFPVIPPEKADFNYPDPPREGAPGTFVIAEDGQARCVIVQPAGASPVLNKAAAGLRVYLQLVTGATFRALTDGAPIPGDMGAIHVGATTTGLQTKLYLPRVHYGKDSFPNRNGFLIRTVNPKILIIRGETDTATMHGVVGFLERYVGVRQYWPGDPGEIGDVVPSRPSLSIPELEWRDWPYFFSRSMSMYPFGPRRPLLDFFRGNSTLKCSENFVQWLPPEKYGQTHPEYFPLVNGKRSVPTSSRKASGWQPCVSNPEVRRIMADGVLQYFREHPDAVGINFSVNDGNGDCMCVPCRALDAPSVDYSRRTGMCDRYIRLANQVCDRLRPEFPNKILVFLAYSATRFPPEMVKLDAAVLPVLTVPGNFFAAWDAWMRAGAQRMGMYLHHDDDFFFILPKFDPRACARRIRYAVASGRARLFYMEMFPLWPITGPVPYVVSELLWDPRQDVDALLDDFYARFFGPAAEPMKRFYQALESGTERWRQEEGADHWFGRDLSATHGARSPEQFKVLNPFEADGATAALAQAAAQVKNARAPRIFERVRIISLIFNFQKLGVLKYWARVDLERSQVRSEADAGRVVQKARDILALGQAMSKCARQVLEGAPGKGIRLFQRPTGARQNFSYQQARDGRLDPQRDQAITAGMDAANRYLRKHLGPEQAGAWWEKMSRGEKSPTLIAAFAIAARRARGIVPKNTLSDPGFEERGKEFAPDELAPEQEPVLDRAQEGRAGLHFWFRERSPYRAVLTRKERHSGAYSLLLEYCHRARLTGYARVQPGRRYRVGFWIRHNAGPGAYRATISARLGDGKEKRLAALSVPRRTDKWQQLAVDLTTPSGTKLLFLRIFINGQAPDARCWFDDLMMGEYPEISSSR